MAPQDAVVISMYDVTKETLIDIVQGYVTRTAHEELSIFEKLGGTPGVAKALKTDTLNGFTTNEAEMKNRHDVFGMNYLKEAEPASDSTRR